MFYDAFKPLCINLLVHLQYGVYVIIWSRKYFMCTMIAVVMKEQSHAE